MKRIGSEKSKYSENDIMKLLIEMSVPYNVHFVALNLANLQPLSLNNFDVLKLLPELESLNTAVKVVYDNQLQLAEVVHKKLSTTARMSAPEQCTEYTMPDITSSAIESNPGNGPKNNIVSRDGSAISA